MADFTYHAKVAGFHLINLPTTIKLKPNQKFAIVENITSASAKDPSKTVSYLALETSLNGYETSAETYPNEGLHYVCNPGETFVKTLTKTGYKWMTPQQLGYDKSQWSCHWLFLLLIQ